MKTVIVYFGTKLVLISRVIVTTNSNELEYNHEVTITDAPQTTRSGRGSHVVTGFTSLKHNNKADDSTLGVDSI